MPTLINKSQRLINTHDMVPIPPGVPTEVSAEAMAHADIQQAMADGVLVDAEGNVDPPPLNETESQRIEREQRERAERPDQPSPEFNTGPRDRNERGEQSANKPNPGQSGQTGQQPGQRPVQQQPNNQTKN